MKSTLLMWGLAFLIVGAATTHNLGHLGPVPNAGDGIPDGSGFVSPNGPNSKHVLESDPPGPAPNAGDGAPGESKAASPGGSNTRKGQ